MNLMNVDGYHAKIDYDEKTDQFRGEILGLSGGADFYGSSPEAGLIQSPSQASLRGLSAWAEVGGIASSL